jgi:cell pole-organizing protein PopZ
MSDQTPEPNANAAEDNFDGSEPEPSMEDILASIRKIIADDADPQPIEDPKSSETPVPAASSNVALEAMSATHAEAPIQATPPSADGPVEADQDDDDAIDIDALLTDFIIGDVQTIDEGQPLTADSADAHVDDDLTIPALEDAGEGEGDEVERLMNELIGGADEDHSIASDEKGPVIAAVPAATSVDEDDIDLVKSLMADLTDADEVTQASPVTPSVTDTPTEAEVDDLDAMEDDIFDSILDMTLTAEEAPVESLSDAKADSSSGNDAPSLTDIAAAAEADARLDRPSVDTAPEISTHPSLKHQSQPTQPAPDTQSPDTQSMESPMPRAVRSDAILDDVTEEATMSAFAQLNQVVEDKAILSERGPRIGDLVQEALKPMLKEWLDENLQGIVERAVAKEVKRIATGK